MKACRFALISLVFCAGASSAQALEPQPAAQIQLVCPDRSPQMADISLAMAAGHYAASQAEQNRMLERARSVCAAGLSVVSLIPADDLKFTQGGTLVSDAKD